MAVGIFSGMSNTFVEYVSIAHYSNLIIHTQIIIVCSLLSRYEHIVLPTHPLTLFPMPLPRTQTIACIKSSGKIPSIGILIS